MLRDERQSARMSKITNDGLILSGTVGYALWLYPYGIGNSGRQRVKRHHRKYCHFCKKKFRTKTLALKRCQIRQIILILRDFMKCITVSDLYYVTLRQRQTDGWLRLCELNVSYRTSARGILSPTFSASTQRRQNGVCISKYRCFLSTPISFVSSRPSLLSDARNSFCSCAVQITTDATKLTYLLTRVKCQ